MFDKGEDKMLFTKGEVTEFLSPLDVVAFLNCCLNASHHHGTNADGHHATELRAIDGNDPSYVLAVDIQSSTNCLRLSIKMMSKGEQTGIRGSQQLTLTV